MWDRREMFASLCKYRFVHHKIQSSFLTSIRIKSPSSINAMGPPSTASGATCPTQSPVLPPEKRPSVKSNVDLPRPAPLIAP